MPGCYNCLDIKETIIIKIMKFLKVPLLWVMKGSCLGFGSPQNACNAWQISICECSAALCTALPGKPLFLLLQKQHLVAKNEFAFSFRPMRKDQQVGGNMLIFHVDVNMKRLGIRFKKTTRFNDSELTLSFERQ